VTGAAKVMSSRLSWLQPMPKSVTLLYIVAETKVLSELSQSVCQTPNCKLPQYEAAGKWGLIKSLLVDCNNALLSSQTI
jgi:hypothetical protein